METEKYTQSDLDALPNAAARNALKADYREDMKVYRDLIHYHASLVGTLHHKRKEWDDMDSKASTFLLSTLDADMISKIKDHQANAAVLYAQIRLIIVDVTDMYIEQFEVAYNHLKQKHVGGTGVISCEALTTYIRRREDHEEMLEVLGQPVANSVKRDKLVSSLATYLLSKGEYCHNARLTLEETKRVLLEEEDEIQHTQKSVDPKIEQLDDRIIEMEKEKKYGAEKAMTATNISNPKTTAVQQKCTVCGKPGHIAERCFTTRICHICLTKGHIARFCPEIKSSDPGSDRANLHVDDENFFMDYTGLCLEIPEPTALISTSEE